MACIIFKVLHFDKSQGVHTNTGRHEKNFSKTGLAYTSPGSREGEKTDSDDI